MGWVTVDGVLADGLGAGVGVGTLAVGDGDGDGKGVATGFDGELKAEVGEAPFLLAVLAVLAFEGGAGAGLTTFDDFERLDAVLVAGGSEVLRLLTALMFTGAVLRLLTLVFTGAGEELRLFALEFSFGVKTGMLRTEFVAAVEVAPGSVKTTSNWFECCSTRPVAPGCSRKETTVLSPIRWTFTSANARPRSDSARGISAAGILM